MSNILQLLCFKDSQNTFPIANVQGLTFLNTLFGKCSQGYIEIRPLPAENHRQWIPVKNITIPIIPEDKNIYVGVATRKHGKGSKQDIVEIPAVWVDIDFKDTPENKATDHINAFALKPSILVKTGGGFHLYWLLKSPATSQDIKRIENINKALVNCLGGDKGSADAAHILRLPGTNNYKYDPPQPVTLVSVTPHLLYNLSDFDSLPPVSRAMTAPPQTQPANITSTVLQGVSQGQRHTKAVSLIGYYKSRGLSIDETQRIMKSWNQENFPPLPENELKRTVDDMYTRYENDMASGTSNTGMPSQTDYCSLIEEYAISAHDFRNQTFPAREIIINPWLRKGEIGLIYASRGVGKTWLSLLIGMMATRKMKVEPWETDTPVGCLYIEGEMAPEEIKARLFELHKTHKQQEEVPFTILSSDYLRSLEKSTPYITDANWRNAILEFFKTHKDFNLLILDNLACLAPDLDENSKKEWDPINQWLLQLRSIGTAVIMIHHTGKSEKQTQRGTSGREDSLDFSIILKRPKGYTSEEGAKFTVEFTKGRRLFGKNVKPFTFNFHQDGTQLTWDTEDKKSKEIMIITLLKKGMKNKDIAKEVSCSSSYVTQVKKQALKDGKLTESDFPKKQNKKNQQKPEDKA